ncbi:MAG: ABC transporter substrate-binding protein [Rubrivivax sp.]|nr:ABC transporter substrate-binding protein [Rubrivivax sp.]
MKRRHLVCSVLSSVVGLPLAVRAQTLDKSKLTLAVGGKNLLYYLPLTIAEQRGYFKAEGLDLTIVDFAGGSQALRAVVGGSADVVSGAFEHTVNMQERASDCVPSCCRAVRRRSCWASTRAPCPASRAWPTSRGKKIGVTAPGSSTNVMVNFALAKVGLSPATSASSALAPATVRWRRCDRVRSTP